MEQEPNYGRQREPGDEPPTENVEQNTEQQRHSEPSPDAETAYNETSPGDQSPGDSGYSDPGYADSGYGGSNYGSHSYSGQSYVGPGMTSTMSPQDEKTWSIISHLSSLLMFFLLPAIGPLVVWLIYRDRSPMVRFHAVQALWYQLAWLGIWTIGGILGFFITVVTFGFGALLVAPLGFVAWLLPIIHGCYAAYKVSQGYDFRYPFIADMIESNVRTH